MPVFSLKWNCLPIEISNYKNVITVCSAFRRSVSSTDKRTGRWKEVWPDCAFYLSPNHFQIHKDDWVSEWIWDSAESEPRLPSSFPPRRGTYQITLSLSVWAVISWKTRCDVTDGAHGERAAEGRGHVAPPSNLRRDEERAGGVGRHFHFYFSCTFDCKTHQTPGQRHEFSICKIMLVLMLKQELASRLSLQMFCGENVRLLLFL